MVPILSDRLEIEYLGEIPAASQFCDAGQVVPKSVSSLCGRCVGGERNCLNPEKNVAATTCHVTTGKSQT